MESPTHLPWLRLQTYNVKISTTDRIVVRIKPPATRLAKHIRDLHYWAFDTIRSKPRQRNHRRSWKTSHRKMQVLFFGLGSLFFVLGGLRATFIAASNTAFTFCGDRKHETCPLRVMESEGNFPGMLNASIKDVNRSKDLLSLGAAFYVSDSTDHLLQFLTLQDKFSF